MVLTLSLENDGGGGGTSRALETGRLTIGRDAECDWVLPDSKRVVSRRHCVIERRDDEYWITDTSKNGVYMNGRAEPLGFQHSVQLGDGDRLRLGPYWLSVRIQGGVDESVPQASSSPTFDDIDPFAAVEDSLGSADRSPDPEPAVKPVPPEGGGFERLFDRSWIGGRGIDEASSAAETPEAPKPDESARSFGDHAPPHKEAFNLRSRPPPQQREPDQRADIEEPDLSAAAPPSRPAPPPRTTPSQAAAAPTPDATGCALLEAFLEGAGFSAGELRVDDPEGFMRQLGANYAALAEGLRQLLLARAAIKNEARLERTQLRRDGNNPLKTAVHAKEAAQTLLQPKGPGYLDPQATITASLQDLKAHEIALIDGMQAAVQALLERFDPNELEQQLAGDSSLALIAAGGKKARYWGVFKNRYADIAKRAQRRFMGDFDQAFARAYERRAREVAGE